MKDIQKTPEKEGLQQNVYDTVKKDIVNEILCELPTLAFIQNKVIENFPKKIWHSKKLFLDVFGRNKQSSSGK